MMNSQLFTISIVMSSWMQGMRSKVVCSENVYRNQRRENYGVGMKLMDDNV